MKEEHQAREALGEDELAQRGLPPVAFFDNADGLAVSNTSVVCVKRGEAGCYAVETTLSADVLNEQHGVSAAQKEAMLAGSMFGWECRAAYPHTWELRFGDAKGRRH